MLNVIQNVVYAVMRCHMVGGNSILQAVQSEPIRQELSRCDKEGEMVGARGFEPPTSASRTQRSSQAEPRSDIIKVIVEVRDLYNSIKKLKSNLKSN